VRGREGGGERGQRRERRGQRRETRERRERGDVEVAFERVVSPSNALVPAKVLLEYVLTMVVDANSYFTCKGQTQRT
jgi:hypothetical protein